MGTGLLKVKPYYFDYLANCKSRWAGKPLLDVLNQEFRDRDDAYFRRAIGQGLITLNGQQVTVDTLFEKKQTMGHRVHRHEPPTSAQPVEILHKDDDLIVIDKPGGLQAHPSGRYRHNTVVHLLRKKCDLDAIFPINRLDRLTSGVMLLALNTKAAQKLNRSMTEDGFDKEYLCRVQGEFPSEPVECDMPMRTVSFKFSFQYVDTVQGKPSLTRFERVSFNGRTSVVRCIPVTGRTHQIRVHLRHLGFPIANDPIYGRHTPWSSLLDLIDPQQTEQTATPTIEKMLEKTTFDSMDMNDGQPRCAECHSLLIPDPVADQPLGIWLHSLRYSGSGWSYQSSTPKWAADDFDGDQVLHPAYV
ncbi:pseudouridine synthase [Hesseltinella vesiculosa]|uniref:Pseudouridine synthase n=1 Tax=Hesseltinella vesiculosa TaxID=101127 RepID=A0A1X2GET6_9FUNG|nr:pseudouridine synthase [Hesseltinella vesiculosa]